MGVARFTYGVMLPALRRDLELDYLGGGALNAVHLLGYLAGTLAAPALARTLGLARLARAGHLLVAAGAFVCALAAGPWLLALGRLATGLGAGGAIVAILVLAFAAVPIAARPLASTLVWSGMGFAVVVSGLAAHALIESALGWRGAFFISALLAALLAVIFPPRRLGPSPDEAATPRFEPGQVVHRRWAYLVAAYFMFGSAYIAYSTFAGARLVAAGAPASAVGAMWIAFGIAMIAGSAASFALLRLEGRRKVALVGALAAGALGALVSWAGGTGGALIGALLVGLGLAATPTIVSAYVRERTSGADYTQAFSLATAVMGVGQLLGPLAAGAAADGFGIEAVALFAFSVYAAGAALAALDARVAGRETTT